MGEYLLPTRERVKRCAFTLRLHMGLRIYRESPAVSLTVNVPKNTASNRRRRFSSFSDNAFAVTISHVLGSGAAASGFCDYRKRIRGFGDKIESKTKAMCDGNAEFICYKYIYIYV